MIDFLKWINRRVLRGKLRKIALGLFDCFSFAFIAIAYYILMGMSSFGAPGANVRVYLINCLYLALLIAVFRLALGVYNNIWRYTSTSSYFRMVIADGLSAVVSVVLSRFLIDRIADGFYIGIWFSITVSTLTCLFALFSRFAYRLLYKKYRTIRLDISDRSKTPVAIVGAGQLGAYLASELINTGRSPYYPVCFIDDDRSKIGQKLYGVSVYENKNVEELSKKLGFSEVILAINDLSGEKAQQLWRDYDKIGCRMRVYATPVGDRAEGSVSQERVIRDFSIEDLLFRKPLDVNDNREFDYYKGKTVLVTGGGGSIGSEICRQIAALSPKKLIIFDIYENNAYDIQQELMLKYGASLDLAVEIGSVRDLRRLECVFSAYRPQVVFHAAAHKHVPLMEHSSVEAIKNNVMGTYNTANTAEKYGVFKFILISTDKAVNPTNVMGASKRVCEMIVQSRYDSTTSFAAVRFGNVLGSNGSVIPLFKRQIAEGGPVTITDKRIIRYFMTIPEASQLVMLAGAVAKSGELFVLDMGQPVKIYDLAVNMLKLMGYTPGVDMEIKEIGLRPGEKLYEELLMKGEDLVKTDNEKIFIEQDKPYTRAQVEEKLRILLMAVEAASDDVSSTAVRDAIKQVVPTFCEPDAVNRDAHNSREMKNTKDTCAVGN